MCSCHTLVTASGRACRESGMRYHPFTKAPIRAQIEPVRLDCATSSTLISTLMRWHLVAGLGSYATTGVQHVVQDRMAGTTCRSRLGGPVPRSHHPIAHSAAVPPKFEPPAIGIRALEPSHSGDRFLALVTPIRRPAPTSGCPRTGRLHAGQNGDVGPIVPHDRQRPPHRHSPDASGAPIARQDEEHLTGFGER